MINPTHRLKKFVKYSGDDKPADFHVTEERGWLGSGITDCNGVEIFEGDIVKHVIPPGYVQDENLYIVYFCRCSLLLIDEKDWEHREYCGATPLGWHSQASIEVVGHIAEEARP